MPKNPTSFRLSDECLRLIASLAETLGINQTAIVEQAVRKLARAELAPEDVGSGKRPRPPDRPWEETAITPQISEQETGAA